MIQKKFMVLVCFAILTLKMPAVAFAAPSPDPKALLQGVEQSRKALHGRFKLRMAFENVPAKPSLRELDSSVEFDSDKWRFIQTKSRLSTPSDRAVERDRFMEANGGDILAAQKAGLGKVLEVKTTSVFNGVQFAQYSDQMGAHIFAHQNGSSYLCFDPRALGLARGYSPNYSLHDCLGLDGRFDFSLVGLELLNGQSAWHVIARFKEAELDYHFWISDQTGFRVHRYEYRAPRDGSETHLISNMDYEGDNFLPSRVVIDELDGKRPKPRKIFTIMEADFNFKPEQKLFGLQGLDMPVGTIVGDDRVKRVAGYFDGIGLTDDYRKALDKGAEVVTEEIQPKESRTPLYVAFAVVALLFAFAVWRRSARNKAVA